MQPKSISFYAVSMLLLLSTLFNSCTSHSDNDAECQQLLKTIPEDATLISIADLESLTKKIGTKTDDGEILFTNNASKDLFVLLSDADSGIKQSIASIYIVGESFALTGFIENEETFKNVIEMQQKEKWISRNEFQECGNIIMRSNQFWFVSDKEDFYDSMLCLDEKKSAFSNDIVADLLPLDKDVEFFINQNKILSVMLKDFAVETSLAIGVTKDMLVKDFAYALGHINFEAEYVDFDFKCLTSKGKPAEFALPLSKINSSIIDRLPSQSDVVIAFGPTTDFWKTLNVAAESIITSSLSILEQQIYKNMIELLMNINKGFALGAKAGETATEEIVISLQSKDEQGAEDIARIIRTLLPTIDSEKNVSLNVEGEFAEITYNTQKTKRGIPEISDAFDGKYLGLYISGYLINNQFKTDIFKRIEITCDDLSSASGRVYLNLDDNTNSLSALYNEIQKQNQ